MTACLETSASRAELISGVCARLRERSLRVDAERRFPAENWQMLVESRLTGLTVPVEFGGEGVAVGELLEIVERIGSACPSTGLCLLMHSCATSVIAAAGSEALNRVWLPAIARGEHIVAYAGTEQSTGTNFWALESCAVPSGDGFRLRLRKSWATLAEAADLFVIPTRAHPSAGPEEISLFLVTRGEGVKATQPWRGSGMRGSSSGPVEVDAWIPAGRLMGIAGRANTYITTDMFNLLLLSHAALYSGIAGEALTLASERARTRVFAHTGEALCDTSLWQSRLGELSAEVQACAALVARAGREAETVRGRLLKGALAAKICACSLARRATDLAMQLYGGSGYNSGERVELLWRDARAGSLMRPSDEVAQMILGKIECCLEPFEVRV